MLLILFCFPLTLLAQDCDFTENEKDEFTKAIKIETKPFRMGNGMFKAAKMGFRKVNENYFIYLAYTPASTSIMEDDVLMFKTDADSIIKAIANKTALPTFAQYGSSISLYYRISKEDLIRLSQSNVNKLRVYFRDGYSDFDVAKKSSQLIKSNANCIIDAKLNPLKKKEPTKDDVYDK